MNAGGGVIPPQLDKSFYLTIDAGMGGVSGGREGSTLIAPYSASTTPPEAHRLTILFSLSLALSPLLVCRKIALL